MSGQADNASQALDMLEGLASDEHFLVGAAKHEEAARLAFIVREALRDEQERPENGTELPDALDLLHRRIANYASVAQDHEGFEALATVRRVLSEQETENERLREERDALELRVRRDDDQQKIDAWWRARSEVKIDGNSRAEYVLQRDAAWERADAAEAEVERLREGLRFIAARRVALETFGLGNIADTADRALLAGIEAEPDGKPVPVESLLDDEDYEVIREEAGIHSADPATVTPEMMRDAGRGTVGGDPWESYGATNRPDEGGEA